MEAALFTLDVILLVLLIIAVRKSDRLPESERNLGVLAYLEAKSDEVQKGLRKKEGKGVKRA